MFTRRRHLVLAVRTLLRNVKTQPTPNTYLRPRVCLSVRGLFIFYIFNCRNYKNVRVYDARTTTRIHYDRIQKLWNVLDSSPRTLESCIYIYIVYILNAGIKRFFFNAPYPRGLTMRETVDVYRYAFIYRSYRAAVLNLCVFATQDINLIFHATFL